MKFGPRFAAIETLCQWHGTGKPVDLVMDRCLGRFPQQDPKDGHLVMALVYGVLRWCSFLDWIAAAHSSHPLAKMKLRTLYGLRVGLYQLLFMDRIPASAAINETVQALKDGRQPKWLTGFVNGVLRTIARRQPELPDPLAGDAAMPDHVRLSHPEWLLNRWTKRYGAEHAFRICRADNTPPLLTVRVNSAKIAVNRFVAALARAGIEAETCRFSPQAVAIAGFKGPVSALPGFADGLFQVQDEAAQLVSLLPAFKRPGRYLDGCAGLGGKTSHLAGMLPPKSTLLAIEPDSGRIRLLKENLARLDLAATVAIRQTSLKELLPDYEESFDGILIDAPCSGLGVIRRHPDIRWNRKPEDLKRYQKIQQNLLKDAVRLLAPGGVVVYATCSLAPEENDEVVHAVLAEHPDMAVTDARHVLPAAAAGLVDQQGFLRTVPDDRGLDGFFAARMEKALSSPADNP